MNIQQHKSHFLLILYKLIIVQFDTPVPQTHANKGLRQHEFRYFCYLKNFCLGKSMTKF